MGAWEFLDEIGDGIEEGTEAIGRGMGEVAGKAAHLVGDGLDAIGLHSAAQAVDGFGDDVADTLGAQVGESQLGETDDPAKLVHGDVATLTETSGHLAKFGAAFGKTADGLHRIDTAHWTGDAADRFRAQYHQHPTQWSDAAEACTRASGALTAFGAVVKWAQAQAAEAVRLYNQAKQASARARDAYDRQVDAYNAEVGHYNDALDAGSDPGTPPTKPGGFADPGVDGLKRAQQLLSDARTRRNSEGDRAKAALDEATAKAPAEPRFTDRLLDDTGDLVQEGMDGVTHFYGGIVKGAGGILKFGRSLNPLDPYNMTHPAEYAAGLSGTAAGLLHTVNHPMDLLTGMLGDGWGSDPFEAMGKLIPNVALTVATDGAGAAGERVAMAGEEAAESAAMTAGRGAATDAEVLGERTAGFVEPPPFEPPPVAGAAEDFGPAGHDFGPAGHDFGPAGPADDVAAPAEHPGLPSRQHDWDSFEHEDPLAEHPQYGDISDKLDGDHPPDLQPAHEPPNDVGSQPDHHPTDTDLGADSDSGAGQHPDHTADYSDPGQHATDADHQAFDDKFGPGNDRLLQEQIGRAPDVGLANQEIRALDHYTGMAHQDLNVALRENDLGALGYMDPEIREMVSGLNKLPAYEGPVYRGVEISDTTEFLDRYQVGRTVQEPAFTSSDIGTPFSGNVQLEIESTTGRDISWLKDPAVGQQEVLFPPGTNFEVLERVEATPGNWKLKLKEVGR